MVNRFRVISVSDGVKETVFVAETRVEAERLSRVASKALGRDTSIGIETIKAGEREAPGPVRVGPIPRRRPGRTREEQQRVEEKAARLGEIERQRRTGRITEREARRLRDRPELARGEVVSLREVRVPTFAPGARVEGEPEVLTRAQLGREKALARQERAIETRRRQLRAEGREVIQEPTGRAFGVLTRAVETRTRADILPEIELREQLERTRGFVTFREPETVTRTGAETIITRRELAVPSLEPTERFRVEKPSQRRERRDISGIESQFEAFTTGVTAQRRRQLEFETSAGFQRIENIAGVLTGGARIRDGRSQVLSIEERGPVGGVAQALVRDIAGFPIAVGGGIAGGIEKLRLTGRATQLGRREIPGGFIEVRRREIAREFGVGAPTRVVTQFQALPVREKIATGLFVGVAPFLGGGPIRRLFAKRITRTKAIAELSPRDLKRFERFELSVEELKGVRTQPKKLNLLEVERLTPKAAKALEKVILERKEQIVIGGSVAQRTQIEGKSRIPADVDIFTRGSTRELTTKIATELTEAGVKRVSTVRGKQVTIAGKKAVEVKELSLLEQNISKVQLPFRRVASAFAITPRGITVLRLGAQAQRKLVGGFGLEQERIRTKDITDLPNILRQLRKSKAGSLSRRPRAREPSILASQFPKPLRREPSSIIGRGRGEPSGLGGPFLSRPSTLRPFDVSRLIPEIQRPSIFRPRKERPSVLRPFDISTLTPSVLTPSQLTPFPSVPPTTRRPPFSLEIPRPRDERRRRNVLGTLRRSFRGTPSLSVVLGGPGVQLTPGQIAGKETISPFLIRQISKQRTVRSII